MFFNLNSLHKNTVLRNGLCQEMMIYMLFCVCSITTCLLHSETMKYWFIVENMYFFCTYSIKTKIISTLGTGYFLKITKINSQLEKPVVLIAKISSRKTQKIANCWFSHDVTKIQTTKLSILVRFYFHGVLEQLKTNFQTNFRFKRVLGFVIEYA